MNKGNLVSDKFSPIIAGLGDAPAQLLFILAKQDTLSPPPQLLLAGYQQAEGLNSVAYFCPAN